MLLVLVIFFSIRYKNSKTKNGPYSTFIIKLSSLKKNPAYVDCKNPGRERATSNQTISLDLGSMCFEYRIDTYTAIQNNPPLIITPGVNGSDTPSNVSRP